LGVLFCLSWSPCPPRSTLFPYTTLFRSALREHDGQPGPAARPRHLPEVTDVLAEHLLVEEHERAHRLPLGGGRHVAFEGEVGERSEEHTSELQSRENLVCRLLLEKKNIA